MIIFPQKVSMDDADWVNAMALCQVLPIDTRNRTTCFSRKKARVIGDFFVCAGDFLVRDGRWDGRQYNYPPFYYYSIYFSVSAAIIGFIPVNDIAQQNLFQQVLNAALSSPYTVAFRNAYEVENGGESSRKISLLASADYHFNCALAEFPNESFDEILARLLEKGRQKLNPNQLNQRLI